MRKCPVCETECGALTVCPKCGFDGSCDYERYPTAFTVRNARSTRALRREWEQKQGPAFNSLLMDWFMESWQEKNQTAAERCFRKKAEAGDPEAQLWLGASYECGAGAARNLTLAADWYRRAAIQGSTQAQKRLALLKARDCQRQARQWYESYMNEVDREKGITYLIRAAEMGCADAQRHLGRCCELGSGVPRNADDAIKWYGKAAEQGNEDAQKRLAQLLKRLNRQEGR